MGGVEINDILKNEKFKINDFTPYIPISTKTIQEKKIEMHYLGYYLSWDQQKCYYYAAENTGVFSQMMREALDLTQSIVVLTIKWTIFIGLPHS